METSELFRWSNLPWSRSDRLNRHSVGRGIDLFFSAGLGALFYTQMLIE
jgi:hypothetical protein